MEKGSSTWGLEWTSDESEWRHFGDHGYQFGADNIFQYTSMATKFAQKPVGGHIKAFIARNGSMYKFCSKTGAFIIVSRKGKIVTFFKPDNGIKYFHEQWAEEGVYAINL